MSKRKDFCDLSARQQRRRIVNLTNEVLLNRHDESNINVPINVNNATFTSVFNNSDNDMKYEATTSKDMTYEDDRNFVEITSNSDTENDIDFALKMQNDMISDITNDIRSWIVKHNISHIATNDLLEILRKHNDKKLAKDVRSLMKTPRNVHLNTVYFSDQGKYCIYTLV